MQSTIELFRTAHGWTATASGPHGERIKRLFGTYTLPTGYTVNASPAWVLGEIKRLNPDCAVKLAA